MKKFKAHFNRVNMQRGNPNVWTVHTSKACIQVEQIKIYVPVETVFRPDKPQPRAYFTGEADIYVHDNTAYLVNEDAFTLMSDDEYFDAVRGKKY